MEKESERESAGIENTKVGLDGAYGEIAYETHL